MKIFDPIPREGGIREWLKRFVLRLEEELLAIRKLIPGKAPGHDEVREKLLNDPEFMGAIYAYFNRRKEREDG